MIQVKNVVDALYGMVGWKKDLSDNINITNRLMASESGLYYQDAHPLLTLKNLSSVAPDFSNHVWDEYDAQKTYHKGDVVAVTDAQTHAQTLYMCLAESVTGQNPASSSSWEAIEPFSVWLEEKTRAAIATAVNRFIYSVMPKGGTKSLLEHRLLFNSVSRIADRVPNKDNIVGLEVHPTESYDACVKIHRIGLTTICTEGNTQTDNIRLKVKDSNAMLETLVSENLLTGMAATQWLNVDVNVPNKQGGHCLYVYYDQRDLNGIHHEAVNRTIDWSKAPCPTCSNVDYQAFIAWSRYIEVWPFYVARQNLIPVGENDYTFDQQDMFYMNKTNFGLNLEISVFCDYTDFIIRNKGEFVTLIMKQVAAELLKEFAYNPNVRANRNSINASRMDVMAALDGSNEKQGLLAELENMYKGLNVSMKGLDKVCRPCNNNGLRYTTT